MMNRTFSKVFAGASAGIRFALAFAGRWTALGLVLLAGGWAGCASKPVPPPPPRAWAEADRLSRQAARLQSEGDWNGALAWWDRAARQFQLLNDRTNLAMAWHNQGMAHRALGRTDEATTELERAAKVNAELGLTDSWWRNQIGLLQVANDARSPRLEELLRDLDRQPGRPEAGRPGAVLAHERARAWMTMGRLPEALEEAGRARVEFESIEDRAGRAAAQVTVAKILRRLGRFREAEAVWREVLVEFEAMGDPRGVAVSLAGWGGCLADAGGDLVVAEGLLKRAEENYFALGLKREAETVAGEREALSRRAREE